MKKLLILILATLLAVSLFSCGGTPTPTEGLEYRLLDDGTYEVVGIGAAADLEIVIPSEHGGVAISSIGQNAFSGCYNLKSITVGNGIVSIGDGAFSGCTSLERITLPDTLESLGTGVFLGCEALTYKEYDGGKYLGSSKNPYLVLVRAKSTELTSCKINGRTRFIGSEAFFLSSALESIDIPDNVKYIGYGAFRGCYNLKSISLSSNITRIESELFSGCSSLTELTIPSGTLSIGSNAFSSCSSLESIYIPASVDSIEAYAFNFCTSLLTVECEREAVGENWSSEWLGDCKAELYLGIESK